MSGFHTTRQRFKSGSFPPVVPPRSDADVGPPLRRKGNSQSTERDIKRFTIYLNAERGVSPLTTKKYVHAVKRLKEWARRKRKSLPELTTTDCRRWLMGLAKEAYSRSTINGMHSAAAIFCRFLVTDSYLTANPFEPIPYLAREDLLPRFLSPEEAERLMNAPDTATYTGLLDRTVMELLYSSGARVTELINLRLNHVDIEKRRILCTGKGSKERIVIFGRPAQKWLKQYLTARAGIPGGKQSRYLFLKSDGKRIYATYVWRHIREHGLMVGLTDMSPRVLRHTFATHLHAGGASIRHVQALLGHEDVESTQVYTHLVQTHLRAAYDEHHPRASLKRGPPRVRGRRHRTKDEGAEE